MLEFRIATQNEQCAIMVVWHVRLTKMSVIGPKGSCVFIAIDDKIVVLVFFLDFIPFYNY